MSSDSNVVSFSSYMDPVRKTISVGCAPERAFSIFTDGISRWWPLKTLSLSQARAVSCAIEPRLGGAVYEVADDGVRIEWGEVLVWEPPSRLVMSWHPGSPADTAQEVEVRFTPQGAGTRVDLEHRGWEKLGERAAEARSNYDGGWVLVFETLFAQACADGDNK